MPLGTDAAPRRAGDPRRGVVASRCEHPAAGRRGRAVPARRSSGGDAGEKDDGDNSYVSSRYNDEAQTYGNETTTLGETVDDTWESRRGYRAGEGGAGIPPSEGRRPSIPPGTRRGSGWRPSSSRARGAGGRPESDLLRRVAIHFHRGKRGDADDNFSLFDGVKCLVVLSFTNIQEEIAGR
ncbi:LOW QUALITY PROTEIN: hypothetical protein ACHAWF_016033 [Thalassiosira exigua]